jgi:hypothetical protein
MSDWTVQPRMVRRTPLMHLLVAGLGQGLTQPPVKK